MVLSLGLLLFTCFGQMCGAEDGGKSWWAFKPLSNASPPELVTKDGINGNIIDQWVFSRLVEIGVEPNPQANRRLLMRRASFDLLGMPPTPEQVQAFQNDSSVEAWGKVVSGLLSNEHYGERWGRHWLDLARYGESSGFEHDYDRPSAYHYRDFVIKALNADMPYDQFVQWQIAGDEYEPENPLAMMATGFLGAGVFPTQITANEVERVRYDAMDDMLSTTGTAMLGLTVGCARCHDHKADPISSLEYYQMLSTFTTTVRSEIELELEPEKYQIALKQFEKEHVPYKDDLKAYETNELAVKFDQWLQDGAVLAVNATWALINFQTLHSKAGATFHQLEDGSYLVEGKNGVSDVYTMTAEVVTQEIQALRLEALADPSMKKDGPGRADNGNMGLSRIRVFVTEPGSDKRVEVQLVNPRASFEQNASNLSVVSAIDENPKTGWAVDPEFGKNHAAIFEFERPLSFPNGAKLEVRLEFDLNARHNIGRPRLALTTLRDASFEDDALPLNISSILQQLQVSESIQEVISKEDRRVLMDWWKTTDPDWQALEAKRKNHAQLKPESNLTKVLVCAEGFPAVRMHTQGADFFEKTFFLKRGSTDSKGDVVSQGFIGALLPELDVGNPWEHRPPKGAKYSGRRRSLAKWMTDDEKGAGNLLARVIVNRLWQYHFGAGLVATPNDFGVFGERSQHPELLDWLASELIRNKWRLKPMHQLIMTSKTYQQTSDLPTVKASKKKGDASSYELFFPTHRRLEAEAIRDSLLAVSGQLDTRMFGAGSLDPSSLRRSIYLTIKRSRLITAMQAFDAPEPLVSQATRPTTTVAPQALLLMNSPFVRSWAAAFSERIRPLDNESLLHTIENAYQLALNREPTRLELTEGAAFIAAQTERHRASGAEQPTSLALTDFAQVIFNLNEFIYVD